MRHFLIIPLLGIIIPATVAVAADPLRLQYIFLGSEQTASQSLNAIFKEDVNNALSGTANSFRNPNTYRIDILVEISPDRSTVSFLDFRYVDVGVSLSVTNQFDLGFGGTVPYTARLDEFRYELNPLTVSLALDGTFNTSFQPSTTTLVGSSSMFGTPAAFSLSGATTTRVMGKFIPAADLSQTALQLTITARSPEGGDS